MTRVLFTATTTGYQTRMFGEAAERLGVQLVFATDRCDQLDDPWWDGAIAIRFHEEDAAVEAIVASARQAPFDGVLAVGDRPTVIAARVAELARLPWHTPEGARASRDKRLTRERLREGGLSGPSFRIVGLDVDARTIAAELEWPVVVKPLMLSGSRGVMRADSPETFAAVFDRLRRLLLSPDIRRLRDPAADQVIIEDFVAGHEFALEGILSHGQLRTLAVFDKPDPLDGPFFEETLYVTPTRAGDAIEAALSNAVAEASRVLGLHHGPVHAECRVNASGVVVLEVAGRPIGGLCARALRFDGPDGARAGLEELLLRHSIGEDVSVWSREAVASGVMMIPIPAAGVFRRVDGVEAATATSGVTGVEITAKPDQMLVPIPEGASYLGFIFASGPTPREVEDSLREAHRRLSFTIERAIGVNEPRVSS